MDRVTFKINGVEYSVGRSSAAALTLLDVVRERAALRGTKYMCREGGCGACLLSVRRPRRPARAAVNSCLVAALSCHGWDVSTVERLGAPGDAAGPALQRALAARGGTQCGHCTPGWLMAMYSLLDSAEELTMLDIEKSFGSNVCRCTGYRPILEAFKEFAVDAPKADKIPDIEDSNICKKTGKNCNKQEPYEDDDLFDGDWCLVSGNDIEQNEMIKIDLKDGKKWFKVHSLSDVFTVLHTEGDDSYMLVAGNTAKGAYPIEEYPRVLLDISDVSELQGYLVDQNLLVGAGSTLSELLQLCRQMARQEYFEYLQNFYDHLSLVAHIPVRNLGTIGGNLMIKHQHNEFPSDVFLLLETVGARLTLVNSSGSNTVSMRQFLKTNMRGQVILNVILPPLSARHRLVTYKMMPRSQNAHAVVNAGFLYELQRGRGRVAACRLVFGGLSARFVRALVTEATLVGKELFTDETLQLGIRLLKMELVVTDNPPEPSVEYRKQLAINLFYKGLLQLCPASALGSRLRSGARRLREERALSAGRQVFHTNPALWPLNQPVEKLEAKIQCSGEALYTEDLPPPPSEVFAALVLSAVPRGTIADIDPAGALKYPEVIAFYSAKDIPGVNSFLSAEVDGATVEEEILCSGDVKYHGQPLGVVVAETRDAAERGAALVRVVYADVRAPVIDIKEAKRDSARSGLYFSRDASSAGSDVRAVFKGSGTLYGQYHFPLETLVCSARPTPGGVELHVATQWLDSLQLMVARALGLQQNKVDVHVTRLGGAYGFKISRPTLGAAACALAARVLRRPCRLAQPLATNMRALGKRFPCSADYEVGVDACGVVQYARHTLYEDNGHLVNELLARHGVQVFANCYDSSRWSHKCYNTVTDTAKNTWCRSPGTLETITMVEMIMERIAHELSLDPLAVRLVNLDPLYRQDVTEMVETLITKSQHAERRKAVDEFNAANRWKKRGLRFALVRWQMNDSTYLDVTLSVYHGDGSVALTHGGVEMGQGVNTKAAQICAYFLKIPMEKIEIKGNNTMSSPNANLSGGSYTSQFVGVGVQRCCEELLRRLAPVRAQLCDSSWERLVGRAFELGVDLQTHGFVNVDDKQIYDIFGAALGEVELDVLTGEYNVVRVDLLQDAGRSVSPEIDVGQVEGAFVMGLGYFTSEQLVYAPSSGELLTARAWNYYVPLARDIPQDLRVYFRDKSFSNDAILGSKATGEPPLCLALCVPLALREAVSAARRDSVVPAAGWWQIDGPHSVESVLLAARAADLEFSFG